VTRYVQTGTDPVLHYDTGHPTRLTNHSRLGAMLAEHGEPYKIERSGCGWRLTWWPPYPGLPSETYELVRDPWNDGRTVVRVSGAPAWSPKPAPTPPREAMPRTAHDVLPGETLHLYRKD
jgi:hypothetical protein